MKKQKKMNDLRDVKVNTLKVHASVGVRCSDVLESGEVNPCPNNNVQHPAGDSQPVKHQKPVGIEKDVMPKHQHLTTSDLPGPRQDQL